jgi:hypothetical protein
MTIRTLLPASGLTVVFLALLTGCPSSNEQLTPVKGKVTYKGAPLPGGTIVFIPDPSRGTHGRLAVAEIQTDGTFSLKTDGTLGAVPGWHKVTVASVQAAAPGQVPLSLVPVKYRDPQQSGLSYEVQANKTNTVDLDLD